MKNNIGKKVLHINFNQTHSFNIRKKIKKIEENTHNIIPIRLNAHIDLKKYYNDNTKINQQNTTIQQTQPTYHIWHITTIWLQKIHNNWLILWKIKILNYTLLLLFLQKKKWVNTYYETHTITLLHSLQQIRKTLNIVL